MGRGPTVGVFFHVPVEHINEAGAAAGVLFVWHYGQRLMMVFATLAAVRCPLIRVTSSPTLIPPLTFTMTDWPSSPLTATYFYSFY